MLFFEKIYYFFLNIFNIFYNFSIFFREAIIFYPRKQLYKLDFLFFLAYSVHSPFTISRKDTEQFLLPEDLTIYGETPWITIEKILKRISIKESDHFFELGFGTGRTLLFVNRFFNIPVTGFELIPTFVEKAQRINQTMPGNKPVNLLNLDWFTGDLTKGTIFYITGTCYSDEQIELMLEKMREIPDDSYIITTSFPIQQENIIQIEELSCLYSWGKGTVFIHKKRGPDSALLF